MNNRIPVIIDTGMKPGDAAAIELAWQSCRFDFLGVTTVWGNCMVAQATARALAVVDSLCAEIPVYEGCPASMARHIYTKARPKDYRPPIADTAWAFPPPPAHKSANKKHAVAFLIDAVLASHTPVTLIVSGALTNIACALRIAPEVASKISSLIIVGGGIECADVTMAAERNFWHDPEAASIVFASGAPVLLFPLDVIRALPFSAKGRKEVKPSASMFSSLLGIHYLLDPGILAGARNVRAMVSLDHGTTAGSVVLERRPPAQRQNITIAERINPCPWQIASCRSRPSLPKRWPL